MTLYDVCSADPGTRNEFLRLQYRSTEFLLPVAPLSGEIQCRNN